MKLVVIGAAWCGPCKMLKAALKKEGIDYTYVDADQDPTTASNLGVRGVPCSMFFEGDLTKANVKRTLVGYQVGTIETIKETLA